MAKALYGHIGRSDTLLLTEVSRLRRRVADLESEVLRLQESNDTLRAQVRVSASATRPRSAEPVAV